MSSYAKIAQSLDEFLKKEARLKVNWQVLLQNRGEEEEILKIIKKEEENCQQLYDILGTLMDTNRKFSRYLQGNSISAKLLLEENIITMLEQSRDFIMTSRCAKDEEIRDTLLAIAADKNAHAQSLFNFYVRMIRDISTKGLEGLSVDEVGQQAPEQLPEEMIHANQIPQQRFTLSELAFYDGQEGRPAYVAINGIVYDVTKISQWQTGIHFGLSAGKDLTQEFSRCHADQQIISKLPQVGILT